MRNKEEILCRNFKPKITAQYERIFSYDINDTLDRRFFLDLYLLRCDFYGLTHILEELSVNQLFLLQKNTRRLFEEGVSIIKKMDPLRLENVLDTLEIFIHNIFQKKYNNFVSDIVFIISGFDNIDAIFMDFATSLDALIQKEPKVILRTKALKLCLCTICHGFNSNIVSYFHQKDFFPSIIKYIIDPNTFSTAFLAFLFLGILVNNKKFESQNIYQTRLGDFVDSNAMQLIINIISTICIECKNQYISFQNNESDNMRKIKSILKYFNSMLMDSNKYKHAFQDSSFVCLENDLIKEETPFSQFISFTSYLLQHQSRSSRASCYARLALLIIRILVDNDDCFSALASDTNSSVIHLCRQKQPFLPLVKKYHWQEIWKFFMHFIVFLLMNVKTLKDHSHINELILISLNFISLCITRGENFLFEFKNFEDLIYRLIQNGDIVRKFIKTYKIELPSSKTILSVSEYYENLLSKKYKSSELSPEKVIATIKEGYNSFDLNLEDNKEYTVPFKETKERIFLKSIARIVVLDADRLQL
ncbi:hypothetical protein PCANB_000928 [Pneumocystis canis]|nr:hypothetical protein PCANB_000928 [Pneumocystis canis]